MANRIGDAAGELGRLKDASLAATRWRLARPGRPADSRAARQLFAAGARLPGRAAHPDHPRLRPVAARGLSRPRRESRRASSRSRAAAEQELVRRTLADLMARPKTRGDEALIRDVQLLSRRLGEAGAIEYLQACARRGEAMARLGPRSCDRARGSRGLIDLPDGSVEDLSRRSIAATTAFDCDLLRAIARSQPRLGHGDRRQDRRDASSTGWRWTPAGARRGTCPSLRASSSPARASSARSSPRQIKAEPDYERPCAGMAESVARLASDPARAPGWPPTSPPGCAPARPSPRPTPRPSAPPGSPISTT